jgi:hypothetical protein
MSSKTLFAQYWSIWRKSYIGKLKREAICEVLKDEFMAQLVTSKQSRNGIIYPQLIERTTLMVTIRIEWMFQSSANPDSELNDSSSLALSSLKPKVAIILWPGDSTSDHMPRSRWDVVISPPSPASRMLIKQWRLRSMIWKNRDHLVRYCLFISI